MNRPKLSVPATWQFVESRVPGAYAAWQRDVGLEAEDPGFEGDTAVTNVDEVVYALKHGAWVKDGTLSV